MTDEVRIGRGPAGPHLRPLPGPPKRAPGTGLIVAAAIVLVAAAVAVWSYSAGRADTGTEVFRSADPGPEVVQLDEAGTCRMLIPTLRDAQRQVLALVDRPDMSTVDRAAVSAALVGIDALAPAAPMHMRADIQSQASTMREIERVLDTGINRVIDFEAYRASGIRLGSVCAQYAR